jgi:hypothetical protein
MNDELPAPSGDQVVRLLDILEPTIRAVELLSPPCSRGAETRASALLRSCLGDEQWERYVAREHLDTASPSVAGRVYRIPRAGGRVELYQDGRLVVELCVGPAEWLPPDGVVLFQLLHIQAAEARFLEAANPFPPRRRDLR